VNSAPRPTHASSRGPVGYLLASLLLLLVPGCLGEPAEYRERRLALEAEFKDMDAKLSEVEARLLWAHERVTIWNELAERHQHMSEIACRVNQSHLEEMFEQLAHQEQKRIALNVRDGARLAGFDEAR
jgi:hypothetical protein